MGDSRDAIEQIRQRLNVVDVVSDYVAVKRAGKSSKGLCPFHAEKTPSFTVNEEFQTWHCFGCGEHGDVFSFLMKIENLTFTEALERLAKRAGVELAPFSGKQSGERDLLSKANSLAAAYFSRLLSKTPSALEYLHKRGLKDETIELFKIGYAAPGWDGLTLHLAGKAITPANAERAGLVVKGDRGSFYDRFRHRVMFPIFDVQERVIAFGGRTLGDDSAKYLNSPETPLFSKTRSLYGLNLARKEIAEKGYVIVVEGYTDVTMAYQTGFVNCVATLGTALTAEHIGILSRYTNRILLAYDADSAGMTAALRGAALFDETQTDVRIVRLPAGDDPDSLLRKEKTAEFAAAVDNALPIVEYKLALLREKYDLSEPAGRSSMLRDAVRVLAEVPSVLERERYIRTLAGYHPNFGSGTTRAEDHIRADIEAAIRRIRKSGVSQGTRAGIPRPGSALEKAHVAVLRVLISGGEEADIVFRSLEPDDFGPGVGGRAAKSAFAMYAERREVSLPELLESLDGETGKYLSELAMREDVPPVEGSALTDCIVLIKKSRTGKKRTSDVFAPYLKDGMIDPERWRGEKNTAEYDAFLKESGRRPDSNEQ